MFSRSVPPAAAKGGSSSLFSICRESLKAELSLLPATGKILFLDSETKGIVSLVYSFSELLEDNFYDVQDLGKLQEGELLQAETLSILNCVVFARPTPQNINILAGALGGTPTFGSYYLLFSNAVSQAQLERLARADSDRGLVSRLAEFYLDFHVMRPHAFSVEVPSVANLMVNEQTCWTPYDDQVLSRIIEGLAAAVFTIAKAAASSQPVGSRICIPSIRLSSSSPIARTFGVNLRKKLSSVWLDLLRDPRNDRPASVDIANNSTILILDRRDDLLTPFITPWHYHAMLHEQFGVISNKLRVDGDTEDTPISIKDDAFFSKHHDAPFGEVAQIVAQATKEQLAAGISAGDAGDVDKLKFLLDSFPEQKRVSHEIAKHVKLVHILAQAVEKNKSFDVSAAEQSILSPALHLPSFSSSSAASGGLSLVANTLKLIIDRPDVPVYEKYRLTLLFALKFSEEEADATDTFLAALREQHGVDRTKIDLVRHMKRFAGQLRMPGGSLRDKGALMSIARQAISRTMGTASSGQQMHQYKSIVADLLEPLTKGQLDGTVFNRVTADGRVSVALQGEDTAADYAIIFIIGGATYAEAREIDDFSRAANSKRNRGSAKIYLGGTNFVNTRTLLADICQTLPTLGESNALGTSKSTFSFA